jgi:hypothetical protein
LIGLANVWLHFATRSTDFDQVTAALGTKRLWFGRGLSPNCTGPPCDIVEAYKTVNNISSVNRLLALQSDGHVYVFLGDARLNTTVDFSATSIAVNTRCQATTPFCNITEISGGQTEFTCTNFSSVKSAALNDSILPQITHFDLKYLSVQTISVTPSNSSIAGLISIQRRDQLFPVENAAYLAVYTSDTAQEIADKVAFAFSQTSLGFSAGMFSPRQNTEEQWRSQFIVTRLLMLPLYTFVVFNLIYVIVAIIAAIAALHSCAVEEGLGVIAEQLTIWGLIEDRFRDIHMNFMDPGVEEEPTAPVFNMVVGIQRTGNGWRYRTWEGHQRQRLL